jgi:hypothetical protein
VTGTRGGRIAAGLALLAVSAFTLRAFLGEGVPLAFDAHSHTTRAWLAERALAAGDLPTWTFAWYGGHRLFELYAPGYHVLAGALGLATGDVIGATRLVLFAGQLAALAAVYALMLRLGAAPLVALFAALVFLHDAGRWRLLAVIGNHPSLFVYVAAPLLMLAVLGADGSRRSHARVFAASALAIAMMAAGHLTTSLAVLPALLAFAVAVLAVLAPRAAAVRSLAALAAAVAAAGAATGWLTIPLLRDLPLVSLSLERAGIGFDLEPVGIALGLPARTLRWVFVASPGVVWCAIALVMGAVSLRADHPGYRACAVGLAASLLSIATLGDRAALAPILFVAPLCAAALELASRAVSRRAGPRAATALQALAVAAVPIWHARPEVPLRYDPPDSLAVYARIPRGDPGRTFDVTPAAGTVDGVYGRSSFSPYWSGRAIPFGGFPQGAPLAVNVQLALAGKLVQDLAGPQPALSPESRDLLQLLGVAWLVDRAPAPRIARLPVDAETSVRPEPGVVGLAHASAAIFAPRLQAIPAPAPIDRLVARWESDPLEGRGQRSLDALSRTGRTLDHELFVPLLRDMQIARSERRAERLFAAGLPQPEAMGAGDGAGFHVLAHREGMDLVEITARAGAPGFVRLAYGFDPALRVALDGEPVASVPDFLGGMVIAFPAGEHAIALRAPRARLQGGLLAGGGAFAAALLLVWAATFLPRATRATLPR